MTLLCFNNMGCGQSKHKKSKHKNSTESGDTTKGYYDNKSYKATSSFSGAGSSKRSLRSSSDVKQPSSGFDLASVQQSLVSRSGLSDKSAFSLLSSTSSLSNGELKSLTEIAKEKEARSKDSNQPSDNYGPLYSQVRMSASQCEFFKLLDEKINRGPDYDSEDIT